ncbi:MAG: hypothetical protein ACE5FJ_02435 [Gemmatimonadales bacterium]
MVRRVAGLVLAVSFLGAQALAGQGDPRLSRLDDETRGSVERLIQVAESQGIPTEPLVDKALEGVAKRAPGGMIVHAVRRLHADLLRARNVMGDSSSESELTSGAHALRAGLDENAISALRDIRPGTDLTIPLGVLTDLVAIGVNQETATRAVVRLASLGATDAELLELQRLVVDDIRAGYPPVIAASVRSGLPTAAPPPLTPVVVEGVATTREP